MPEFAPGSVHNAVATFHNPKSAGFDYNASLCIGTGWTEMAIASFHLDGGQSKTVQFPVTMPVPGTYPVGFKVSSGGKLIGALADPVTISVVSLYNYWCCLCSPAVAFDTQEQIDAHIATYHRNLVLTLDPQFIWIMLPKKLGYTMWWRDNVWPQPNYYPVFPIICNVWLPNPVRIPGDWARPEYNFPNPTYYIRLAGAILGEEGWEGHIGDHILPSTTSVAYNKISPLYIRGAQAAYDAYNRIVAMQRGTWTIDNKIFIWDQGTNIALGCQGPDLTMEIV